MQFITSLKLAELEKQRAAYDDYSKVIDKANAAGDDLLAKVEILLDGVRSWTGSGSIDDFSVLGGKLNIATLDVWLLQAKKDPDFSPDVLRGWANTLESHIRTARVKYECAKLFGSLLNEWQSSGDAVATKATEEVGPGETGETEHFVEVGRKEMHEQKERFNSIVFEAKDIDTRALTNYLSELFSDKSASKALEDAQESMEEFSAYLQWKSITAEDVKWTISSLLSANLMTEDKIEILREFKDNELVLDEVASVLNMRLANLATWSWPQSGLPVEMRRHLNGKYRMFTDPEILDALFLHYLGVSWQVKFKQVFRSIFQSKAWKPSLPLLTKQQLDRRRLLLKETDAPGSIEQHRKYLRESNFLLSQLPDNVHVSTSYDNYAESGKEMKEDLLHLLAMDCELDKVLGGQHTILRTDLEWFGPSLPHASILALFKFFGVSQVWLDFFKTFLRAPLRDKDKSESEIRIRERGTPISYALSALSGEVILFGMDFAVNQRADGLFLYRVHDDLWLWHAESAKCVAAWQEMQRYADLVGLTFNQIKTGAVCIGGPVPPELPKGDVRWGFLRFDMAKARLVIDQDDITAHIAELRRQLAATKSVLGWVNAYNKYMKFFARNCGGRPAICFGVEHVDDVIDTLARIQRELFSDVGGNAVGHLRQLIRARFGAADLPHGYFYFPISSGGLEVHDPMVEFLAVRPTIEEAFERPLSEGKDDDVHQYRQLKEDWETTSDRPTYLPLTPLEFMSYEEYISGRETRLVHWQKKYLAYLAVATPKEIVLTPAMEASLKGTRDDWSKMNSYQRWIVSMFGEGVMEKFDGLEVVDPTFIPLGMVQLYKNARMRWDQ
jgi:hypothetical protein